MSSINMNKIVSSVIYSKENIELDKHLQLKTQKALENFNKENREDEYRSSTLKSCEIEQKIN